MANKVLITGGAQRIGKALVKHFHQIGWNIVFQYRSCLLYTSDAADD